MEIWVMKVTYIQNFGFRIICRLPDVFFHRFETVFWIDNVDHEKNHSYFRTDKWPAVFYMNTLRWIDLENRIVFLLVTYLSLGVLLVNKTDIKIKVFGFSKLVARILFVCAQTSRECFAVVYLFLLVIVDVSLLFYKNWTVFCISQFLHRHLGVLYWYPQDIHNPLQKRPLRRSSLIIVSIFLTFRMYIQVWL